MADNTKFLPVKFNGKIYFLWEFSFRNFVEGKELSVYIDRSISKSNDSKEITKWKVNNAKVIRWILSSVELHISLTLPAYTAAEDMWSHLRKVYNQENEARRFQLKKE